MCVCVCACVCSIDASIETAPVSLLSHPRRPAPALGGTAQLSSIFHFFGRCDDARASAERWLGVTATATCAAADNTGCSDPVTTPPDVQALTAYAGILMDCQPAGASGPPRGPAVLQRWRQAAVALQTAVAAQPTNPAALLRLGVLRARPPLVAVTQLGNLTAAVELLEAAGSHSPVLQQGPQSRKCKVPHASRRLCHRCGLAATSFFLESGSVYCTSK